MDTGQKPEHMNLSSAKINTGVVSALIGNCMRTMLFILTSVFLFLLISCGYTTSNDKISSAPKDSALTIITEKKLTKEEIRKQNDDQERLDSIRHDKVLQEALFIAKQNINQATFSKEFKTIHDSSLDVTTQLTIGYLFSKEQRHLLIRRKCVGNVYLNIFQIQGRELKPVLYHQQWDMEYVSDTIQDVNGDGNKDFLVNWYGSSGCCLKNFYKVYLLKPDKRTFSNGFVFINPTFSPKEGIIRGVCYGQPGETEMYKFKWNGMKVDTMEYVYPDKARKGHYKRANKLPFSSKGIVETNLVPIPAEYKNIYGYDWFTGKGY
jgi:hypothetical protein